MTKDELATLEIGDIVRHKNDSNSYVVTANYKKYVIAVDTVHITNPDEWIRINKKSLNDDNFVNELNEFIEDYNKVCDCGEPFPKNGYCGHCGSYRRY